MCFKSVKLKSLPMSIALFRTCNSSSADFLLSAIPGASVNNVCKIHIIITCGCLDTTCQSKLQAIYQKQYKPTSRPACTILSPIRFEYHSCSGSLLKVHTRSMKKAVTDKLMQNYPSKITKVVHNCLWNRIKYIFFHNIEIRRNQRLCTTQCYT